MSDHNYPDHFYADALGKVRAVTGKPTGAYDGRGAGSPPYKPGHGYVTDPVTKPAHYQRAGIETIDYIRATLDGPGFEAYCIGNVLKYVSRYREKGGIEDLRKAKVYLGWAIQPLGGIRTAQPEGCNPGAIREAKIAYDMASDHPARIGDVPHERVPKWSPEWVKPPNCDGHPMLHVAIRDHDERLAGEESHL